MCHKENRGIRADPGEDPSRQARSACLGPRRACFARFETGFAVSDRSVSKNRTGLASYLPNEKSVLPGGHGVRESPHRACRTRRAAKVQPGRCHPRLSQSRNRNRIPRRQIKPLACITCVMLHRWNRKTPCALRFFVDRRSTKQKHEQRCLTRQMPEKCRRCCCGNAISL